MSIEIGKTKVVTIEAISPQAVAEIRKSVVDIIHADASETTKRLALNVLTTVVQPPTIDGMRIDHNIFLQPREGEDWVAYARAAGVENGVGPYATADSPAPTWKPEAATEDVTTNVVDALKEKLDAFRERDEVQATVAQLRARKGWATRRKKAAAAKRAATRAAKKAGS